MGMGFRANRGMLWPTGADRRGQRRHGALWHCCRRCRPIRAWGVFDGWVRATNLHRGPCGRFGVGIGGGAFSWAGNGAHARRSGSICRRFASIHSGGRRTSCSAHPPALRANYEIAGGVQCAAEWAVSGFGGAVPSDVVRGARFVDVQQSTHRTCSHPQWGHWSAVAAIGPAHFTHSEASSNSSMLCTVLVVGYDSAFAAGGFVHGPPVIPDGVNVAEIEFASGFAGELKFLVKSRDEVL